MTPVTVFSHFYVYGSQVSWAEVQWSELFGMPLWGFHEVLFYDMIIDQQGWTPLIVPIRSLRNREREVPTRYHYIIIY